jgi:hypothetical protein
MPQTSSSGMSQRQAATAFHSLIVTFMLPPLSSMMSRGRVVAWDGTENKQSLRLRADRRGAAIKLYPERDSSPLYRHDGTRAEMMTFSAW